MSRNKKLLLIWLGVALALRLLWIVCFQIELYSDYRYYHESAIKILSGLGYQTNGKPTAYFPVGYPIFLSVLYFVFGAHAAVGYVANAFLGTGTVLMTYLLGREFFNEKIGLWAAAIVALYPTYVVYTFLLANETLFTFLALSALYLLITNRGSLLKLVSAGLLFGFATLVRSEIIPYAGLALLVTQWPKRWNTKALMQSAKQIARQGIVVYLALFAVVLPWSWRNYKVFGSFILVSTNAGINLFASANPYAKGTDSIDPRALEALKGHARNTEVEENRALTHVAKEYIRENPGHFLSLMPVRFYHLFKPYAEGRVWFGREVRATSIVLPTAVIAPLGWAVIGAEFLGYAVLMGSFAIYLLGLVRRRYSFPHGLGLMPFVLIFYFLAVHLVFPGHPRYAFPLIPLIAMYAAHFLRSTKFDPA